MGGCLLVLVLFYYFAGEYNYAPKYNQIYYSNLLFIHIFKFTWENTSKFIITHNNIYTLLQTEVDIQTKSQAIPLCMYMKNKPTFITRKHKPI